MTVHVPVMFEGWVQLEEVDGLPTVVGIDLTDEPVRLRHGLGGPFAASDGEPRGALTTVERTMIDRQPWRFSPEHIQKVEFESWTVFEAEPV